MKTKELVYTIIDQAKLLSDDAEFDEEEILFLLGKYRAFIIEQRYLKDNSAPSSDNFQELCIDLLPFSPTTGVRCGRTYLRSKKVIPGTVGNRTPNVYSIDPMFPDNMIFVDRSRIRFVGNRQFEKNFIYCSIMADGHLWVTSMNPQFMYINMVKMSGIFSDFIKANELSCDKDDICDIMESEFPIDSALVPTMIEAVLKDILGAAYRPKDFKNNAMDDLSRIAQEQQQPQQQNNQ